MAFPVLQIASALLKNGQDAEEASEARQKLFQQHMAGINDRQTQDLFGGYRDPYQRMTTQFKSGLGNIDRAEQENSNNNIGSMLQQYFMSQKGKSGDSEFPGVTGGENGGPTFAESLGADHDALGAVDKLFGDGDGDTVGVVASTDSWGSDPWEWDSGY